MTSPSAPLVALLLVLAAALRAGDPRATLAAQPGPAIGAPSAAFVEAPPTAGLDFVHVNGATGQYFMPELLGAGAALFDYDNDGDLDAFLVQGGPLEPGAGGASGDGARPTSRLFRNDLRAGGGSARTLRFTDVTDRAGVGLAAYGMGAATGDVDGDGDLDLLVTTFGADVLYRNNGDGTFTDVTATAGISDPQWSTSAAFADYDRDGDLDLFVANYLDAPLAANRRCTDATGARDYCSPRTYRPAPDRLYRNDGTGRFTDVTVPSGVAQVDGNGLGVAAGDYNGDGWLDFYVANDATPNQLWINRKDGTFADDGPLSGAAVNAAGNPEGSMGIASGDYDRDGDEDLFVTNIVGETFVLYANDGAGNFDDVRVRTGVASPTAPFTGFGTDWLDYDNDGWLDLFVANGAVNVVERLRGQPVPFRMRNLLLRGRDGRFEDVTADAGPAFERAAVSRGAAFGDVDNDGDVDILVTRNGGPVCLLLAQAPPAHRWLQVRLEAPGPNRMAVGARIGVERAGAPTLWRRVRTGGSYLSASDVRVHFGLGPAADVSGLIVEWPDGERQRSAPPGLDRLVTIARK